MITVVDYGLGNVLAFINIYKRLNIPAKIATNASELVDARKIILPGVGAFDWAMQRLDDSGMRNCLDNLVMEEKTPILGVCVGMQMMAKNSDEGTLPGLGWVNAEVKKFTNSAEENSLPLPHMGWNDVKPLRNEGLFADFQGECKFYFLHSYYFLPSNGSDVLGTTDYGHSFVSTINSSNIFGTQFHPEKSHHWGMRLLKNFAEL